MKLIKITITLLFIVFSISVNSQETKMDDMIVPKASVFANSPSKETVLNKNKSFNKTTSRSVLAPTDWFITEWKTDEPGASNNNQIIIRTAIPPSGIPYTYLYDVDWGDGLGWSSLGLGGTTTHTYTTPGTYTVKIRGEYPWLFFSPLAVGGVPTPIAEQTDQKKLLKVIQWGTQVWKSMYQSFFECSNLQITATDIPNLSQVELMRSMFSQATALTSIPNIEQWDTSNVTSMYATFDGVQFFNQDIGNWNTSRVTDMAFMFNKCGIFNQDISYKPAITAWDTSQVRSMYAMFSNSREFNMDIGNWNTSNVENMEYMFFNASDFRQDISSWNTSSVTSMAYMFAYGSFNQDISFNSAINAWNTLNVENMEGMFQSSPFNQNIGNWNINRLNNAIEIFRWSNLTLANYDQILIGWDAGTHLPNVPFGAYTDWCQGDAERTNLLGDGWIINDGQLECTIPSCTVLNSPWDTATNVLLDAALTWDSVNTAIDYNIVVTTNPGGIVVLDETVTDDFYIPMTNWLENQTYNVIIIPRNHLGSPTGCTTTSFTTTCTLVTATFTPITICSGDTLILPAISNNGITGSWSPAINNTATTPYTFIPDPGQCVTTTPAFVVTVNAIVTPTFTQVVAICSGDALSPLPTTSNNGITGTWSPAINNTATTPYLFTPNTTGGTCASTATMTITVNPIVTPTFTQVPDVCNGDTLSPLPTTSDNGITGTWSPAMDNTTTTPYTFTPNTGQCAINAQMTITVNSIITPTFTQIPAICSGDTLNLPTTSDNGIVGTWSPAIDNTATTPYLFTPNTTGQCAATTAMTVTVNATIVPTFTQVSAICSGDTLNLPTTSDNGIVGTWSPAIDNTATTPYTFTPNTGGACVSIATMTITVNPIVTPSFTQISDICNGDVLSPLPTTSDNGITGTWSPAMDNTTTTPYTFTPNTGQCAINAQMTITVNPIVTTVFIQIAPICNGDTLNLPTTSDNGITGTWSPAIDNTTTTLYTFTPNTGECATTTQMTIIVNPIVTPIFTAVPDICNGDTLSPLPTTSGNGITGTWSPAIDNTATTTYTFTPDTGQCATTAPMIITVNPIVTPTFTQVPDICGGDILAPLPTTSNNAITGTWSPVIDNTATTTYTFTPNTGVCVDDAQMTITVNQLPLVDTIGNLSSCESYILPTLTNGTYYTETGGPSGTGISLAPGLELFTDTTIYVYATNGICINETNFEITIDSMPVADNVTDLSSCESYILPSLVNGNYFTASQGAGIALFEGDEIFESDTIYIYMANGSCWHETTFNIVIDEKVVVPVFNDIEVCGEYELPELNEGNYFTEPDGMGDVLLAGDIITESQVLYIYKENGLCSDESSFEITIHPITEFVLTTNNLEIELQDILINMNDLSIEYEFSVDGSYFQEENEFLDLLDGNHVLTVRDVNGCVEHTIEFETVSYIIPNFFTPNNDGINDYWNVISNNNLIELIYIYDRYGKIIKILSPNSNGWDGLYNGKPMLETDYWFSIQFYDGYQLKGHFSLNRYK